MSQPPGPVPAEISNLIDQFADTEHRNARKYSNSEPLDESGIYDLHQVAARIYATGFDDGRRVESERQRAKHARAFDAESKVAALSTEATP